MIRVERLSFSYSTHNIFSSAQFEFESGVNVIMGPSGCGKTTLLKVLTGMLNAEELKIDSIFQSRLLVLQEDALIPWLTGWDNLTRFLRSKHIDRDIIKSHKLYGLAEEFIDQEAWQMSYGQRRTIELIRAIMFNPDLLCLDEPLNFIDPDRRKVLSDVLFNENDCRYTLIATHEWNDFSPYASSTLMFDGKLPVTALDKREMVVPLA